MIKTKRGPLGCVFDRERVYMKKKSKQTDVDQATLCCVTQGQIKKSK